MIPDKEKEIEPLKEYIRKHQTQFYEERRKIGGIWEIT
jgi:hypothetical protein